MDTVLVEGRVMVVMAVVVLEILAVLAIMQVHLELVDF